jgi:Dolichyl-phosphate-mannose-protein mannosyltransferase
MTKAASPARSLSASSKLNFFDLAFVLSVLALLGLVGLTFRQYAVSNDEGLQHHYGELIIAYYTSGFTDTAVFGFDNLYLYGGLFDIVAVLLSHLLPFDLFDVRHVLSAVAGIGGIVATWATGRMIAGPRAGFIAAIALAICGVWYGGMFNHTKDVPFASAMMGATFFLLRAARDLPFPRRRDVLWLGVLLGCALGLRATGLLMVGYVPAVVLFRTWTSKKTRWQKLLITSAHALLQFVPAFVLGYIIMIAAWPWAQLNFLNPIRAIFAFAHFHYPIRTIIAGHAYLMSEVPRWYEPAYILVKLPFAVLVGAAGATISAGWSAVKGPSPASDRARQRAIAILTFMVVFPLVCQAVGHGPSFTGMRHFLFVVPPIATLAGIGIDACLFALQARWPAAGLAGLATVATAFALDAATLARLHPYEYLFYNTLVGGLKGASGNYATDYWVNIMPEAVSELERYIDSANIRATAIKPLHYSVAVCGERISFENEAKSELQWTGDWSHADFFIAPTHMNCDQVLRGMTVSVIERLGVPIGVVKDLRGVSPQVRWAPWAAHAPAAGSGGVPMAEKQP